MAGIGTWLTYTSRFLLLVPEVLVRTPRNRCSNNGLILAWKNILCTLEENIPSHIDPIKGSSQKTPLHCIDKSRECFWHLISGISPGLDFRASIKILSISVALLEVLPEYPYLALVVFLFFLFVVMMESANLNLSMLSSALVSAVSNYAEPSGSAGLLARKKIINAAKAIIREVQEPAEMPFEYSVQMGEMAALRQLMDMRVFDNIPDTGSISYKELAAKVGAEEPFVRRLAWMLVATGVLEQVGESSVAHTKFSRIYVGQNAQGQFFQIM